MLSFVVTDILFFYIYNLFYLSELTLSYIQETYRQQGKGSAGTVDGGLPSGSNP